MKKFSGILLFFLVSWLSITAQQLDQIGKKGGIKTSGGISVNQVYKDPVAIGENPYSLVLNGNLTTNLYGLSVPLSFVWSNYQWTYTQPFNQFTLSPSYKWVTLHLGYSSMSFSPYSLNGHTFAGVGVDVTPTDKLKISAMYGQLNRSSKGDTLHGLEPQYQRMGSGFKLQYSFEKAEVGVNLFYAADYLHQPVANMDSLGLTPQENLIIGTYLSLSLTKSLRFTSDISNSVISNDQRISSAFDLKGEATNNYWATKSNLAYNISLGTIGVGVEYVAPGYTSLGSYYMVNDFIDLTANASTALLKGKVTVAVNTGVRKNNLSGKLDNNQKDLITSLALGFNPTEKLSFNLNYSNFTNYTHIRTVFRDVNAISPYESLDTLSFTQINENVTLSTMWRVYETERIKHSLSGNLGYQQATQSQSDTPGNAGSNFMNGSGGYQATLPESGLSAGINFNYSRTTADSLITQAYGPFLFVRKSLLEKRMNTNISLSWNGTNSDGRNMGEVFTARGGVSYIIYKVHQFNLSLAYSQHETLTRNSSGFTAMLGYSFRFDYPKGKSDEK